MGDSGLGVSPGDTGDQAAVESCGLRAARGLRDARADAALTGEQARKPGASEHPAPSLGSGERWREAWERGS